VIKGGVNFSSFRTTESDQRTGFTLGIGHEWILFRNAAVGLGLLLSERGGVLRNKIVGGPPVRYVYLSDIHCAAMFLEIPLHIKYGVPVRKFGRMQWYAGPYVSMGVEDNTIRKRLRFLYEVRNQDDWQRLHYDYGYNEDPDGPFPPIWDSSGFGLDVGLELRWQSLTLDVRYYLDLYDIETVQTIYLYEKLHSFRVMLGIVF